MAQFRFFIMIPWEKTGGKKKTDNPNQKDLFFRTEIRIIGKEYDHERDRQAENLRRRKEKCRITKYSEKV